MSRFPKILKEPLAHFIVLAILILIIKPLVGSGDDGESREIVVSPAKIEQMDQLFIAMWKRPPSDAERMALVDDYVAEEIYYREAKKLGLDQDDAIIRRRLRQKMEYLSVADIDGLEPSDEELNAFLKAHSAKFEISRKLAFEQIFLNPERRGNRIGQDAIAALEILARDPVVDADSLGDATMLPRQVPLAPLAEIVTLFGQDFADGLVQQNVGPWAGPIASSFGLHLVRVTDSVPGQLPALEQVREQVTSEWLYAKRKELGAKRFDTLRQSYDVIVDTGEPGNRS